MKSSVFRATIVTLMVASTLALLTALAIHVYSNGKVTIGPAPKDDGEHPRTMATMNAMRQWVQTLRTADARKLNNTGRIVFTWDQLKGVYPKQASEIDEFVEDSRNNVIELLQKQGRPIPQKYAAHYRPDTVAIERYGVHKYRICLTSEQGPKSKFLEITE